MTVRGHVVVAMDKFKGSLTSAQANDAVATGIADASDVAVRRVAVADGGDGLLELLRTSGAPVVEHRLGDGPARAFAAAGPVPQFGDAVVIESAHVVGLAQRGGALDPLGASSRPVGEAIRTLVTSEAAPGEIVIGVGGTDCTDGGLGLVRALGARALDARGNDLPDGGGALADLAAIEIADLPAVLGATWLSFATDVDSPLIGPAGAAQLFAPQKGADPDQVAALESGLANLGDLLATMSPAWTAATSGMGAGGGMPACATALAGARIVPGAPLAMRAAGLDDALDGAALVITGEGSVDAQTFHGKGPAQVIATAAQAGVPVVIVAGIIEASPELDRPTIRATHTVRERADTDADSMRRAAHYLREIGREIGADLGS